MRLLPFTQQVKVIQKKFSEDAKTALANQLLQRFISCQYLGINDGSKLEFRQNQYGKPYLVRSNFSYSMSNQQGFTSMVISLEDNNEIGIDLASISDTKNFGENYLEHFKDIFHPQEFKIVNKIDNPDELKVLFTEYWALKESYTKKLGVGLNGDLSSYNFQQVPRLKPVSSQSLDTEFFRVRLDHQWESSTTLSVEDEVQRIDIRLAMLNPDIVVSVCGDRISDKNPLLVKIPLQTIVDFFQ